MDEQTENLRDLFIDATGAETATSKQEESPGSLTDRDESSVDERLGELLAALRERNGADTDLDDAAYKRVVRGFYAEEDDATIADALGAEETTVRRARLDCHLVRESDREGPVDYTALKRRIAETDGELDEETTETLATEFDADPETVERLAAVAAAELASARANGRFRDEFRELLTDAAITDSYAGDAREDGLREATEDIETDVSL
ncbi:hypothetical protein JCM17823_15930 [Halorubrum gandharaense]